MKSIKLVLPLLLASASMQAAGDPRMDCKTRSDAMNVLTDVVLVRPVGAALTLAGVGVFVGLAPFSALASIPEPHDAFDRVGAHVVGAPYAYTFERPLGYFSNTCN